MSSKSSRKRRTQTRRSPTDIVNSNGEIIAPGGFGIPRSTAIQASASVSTSTSYSGPIPPPSLLKEYDEVVPGSAETILKTWEDQVRHRIDLEKKVISSDITRSWAGLSAGLLIALMNIATGGFLVYTGHDTAGATIATVGLASLVGVFVYGTRSQRTERVEKAKLMTGKRR